MPGHRTTTDLTDHMCGASNLGLCEISLALSEDYMADFFDQWDFVSADDPTHGTVDYVTREDAEQLELVRAHPDGVFIGVDNTQLGHC